MQKATSLSEAINKKFRGSTDAVRSTFTLSRHLQHPARFLAARRAAQSVAPTPDLAIDPKLGFRIFPPGTFPEAADVVEASRVVLAEALEESVESKRHGKGRKRFLVNLLDPARLHADHPMVRLALRPDLLASIVRYIGSVPVLRSMQVFYSGVVDREPSGSQLYHCDADDVRQIKIFVLCTDVRPENGPLTLLDAERSARVRRATRYRYHDHLTDAQVQEVVGSDPPAQVVGDAGTVCVVDTSRCFHFGARVSPGAAPRLVAMTQFLNPSAFVLAGDYRSGAQLPEMRVDGLMPLQRAVATGDHSHLNGGRAR